MNVNVGQIRFKMSEEQAKVFLKTYDNNLEVLREAGSPADPKQAARTDQRRKQEAATWGLKKALRA
jgi:hypothetical protein